MMLRGSSLRRPWLAILALAPALALAACQKPASKLPAAPTPSATAGGAVQIVTSTTIRGIKLHLPAPTITAEARAATVSLPFRASDKMAWSLEGAAAAPWSLKSTTVAPGVGPEGTDLAVFSFTASGPGSATLMFNLASSSAAGGDSVKTYQATVRAQ